MPDVELPRLADTLVEGTVTRWLKRQGERVARGEPLVEVETDKVNSEIESPFDGTLTEILVSEGETVPVGHVIARITGAGDPAEAAEPPLPSEPAPAATGTPSMRRRIAERMQEARATVDQAALTRTVAVPAEGPLTARFVKAAAAAGFRHVGVAVEVPDGLLVPVVRDVSERTLEQVAEAVADLARRAREGRLRPAEVQGADITVTNVGGGGTLMAFPLVSPGQPAILAPGAVVDGRCALSLCYDTAQLTQADAENLLDRIAAALV